MKMKSCLCNILPLLAITGFAAAAPVSVPDANLELALEQALQLPTNIDGIIDSVPLAGLTEFRARARGIVDLTGLEAATNLVLLDLLGNSVVDVSALQGLTSLEKLILAMNDVADVAPLAGLTNLTYLDLGFGNPFVDENENFDPLAQTNAVTDISMLSGLTKLEYLNFVGNPGIASIAVLSSFTSLTELWAGGSFSDFTPLASLAGTLSLLAVAGTGNLTNADLPIFNTLTNLFLIGFMGEPQLTDLTALTAINPQFLVFGYTGITDLNLLPNFSNLTTVFAPWGSYTSLDGIETFSNLQDLSVEDGMISDISAVSSLPLLRRIEISGNQVSDISALAALPNLQEIMLSRNLITDIQALVDNPAIGESDLVALFDNPLSETAICEQLPALRAKFFSPQNVQANQVCGPGVTLTVNVIGVGNVYPGTGELLLPVGAAVNFSINPVANSGYAYNQTTGAVNTTDTFFEIVLNEDKEITVEFVNTGNLRTLTLFKVGSGLGFIGPGLGVTTYIAGRTANLFANPEPGSYFGGWSGALNSMRFNETLVMDSNKIVTGTLTTSGFELTVGRNGSGSTSPEPGVYRYAAGSVVPLVATDGPNARFDQWLGPVAEPSQMETTVTMTADAQVTAVFASGDFTLTISATGGGATSPLPGIHYYFTGSTAFVQALSTPAAAFVQWTGDLGGQDPTSPNLSLPMNQNRTIAAVFGPPDFLLTISVSGLGSTSPLPGTYGFKAGRTAFVSAVQTTTQVFGQWSGDLGGAEPGANPIALLMNQDRSITAGFFVADHFLTITAPSGGGVTVPAAGTYGFADGATAVLRARPSAGFRFAGWQGDFTQSVPTAVFTMNDDKTVTPVFEAIPETPIVFGSANFEQVIRQHISKPAGSVFPSDLVNLVQVQAGNSNVNNLQGLEFCNQISRFNGYNNPLVNISQVAFLTNMGASDIASCQVTDISPYNYLPFLEDLNFGANRVSDLSGLTVLPSLRRLVAFENDIADISTLANFRTLRELNLNDNEVTDLSPLAGLINLERLRMLNNDVQSVAPLANLLNLRTIALAGSTSLSDISGLAGLTQLQELDLSRCAVSDISALQSMPNLNFVSLINNQVTDLTPLLNNPGFGMDDQLFISGNPLSQVAACEQALELEARGVLVIGAVCDQEAPIITRTGQAVVAVALQSIYTDAGATAFDSQEGNLTSAIVVTNPVNTFAAGTYIVRYNVMDSLGNTAAEVTRTVHVVPSEILLSFQLQLLISGFNSVDANQDGKLGLAELQARIPGITQNDMGMLDLNLSGGLELAELVLATYPGPVHTGDRDADGRFILSEVLRLVQFYNSGGHHCAPGTEDGYAPGPGSTACLRHAADVLPNFIINLTELLRVIQLFNSGGYAACPAQQTEDGYCPGTA